MKRKKVNTLSFLLNYQLLKINIFETLKVMAKNLIVDDNADVLHVMQLLLGSRGFEMEVTTKGEETFSLVYCR